MSTKRFVMATLIASFIIVLASAPLASQQSGSYDPWLDYNEDGTIDISDLHPLGGAYGSSGDATKNVNVTNWPVEHQTLPTSLRLKAAVIQDGTYERRDLIDQSTYYPLNYQPGAVPTDIINWELTSTHIALFSQVYAYQKIAVSPYRVLGAPMVSIAFTMSNNPSSLYKVEFQVFLGVLNMTGGWVQLRHIGNMTYTFGGALSTYNGNAIITRMNNVPIDVWIEPGNRLAIQLTIWGSTWPSQPNTTIDLRIEYSRTSTDNFVVEIPIVENP